MGNPEATRIVKGDAVVSLIDTILRVRFAVTICLDPSGEKTDNVNYESMIYGRN